jgi:Na+-transporting methylmalonyl-CoA/oxaloacetate decarboxylase gamma subunit
MRNDSGPFPAIVLVFLSLTLIVACYCMSQAPQPTEAGIETQATVSESCAIYLSTPFGC